MAALPAQHSFCWLTCPALETPLLGPAPLLGPVDGCEVKGIRECHDGVVAKLGLQQALLCLTRLLLISRSCLLLAA